MPTVTEIMPSRKLESAALVGRKRIPELPGASKDFTVLLAGITRRLDRHVAAP